MLRHRPALGVNRAGAAAPAFVTPALAGLGAAIPDFVLSAAFFTAWVAPQRLPERFVAWCVLVVLLEFFVVHSAGFTGFVMTSREAPQRKLIGMLLLGGFYTLMVGGFALSMKSWWLLWSFWALMINRMMSGLFARGSDGERMAVMATWAAGVFCYILSVTITVMLPLPALGITPEVVAAQGFEIGGLWTSEPHRAVACGAMYFGLIGVAELFLPRWTGPKEAAAPA